MGECKTDLAVNLFPLLLGRHPSAWFEVDHPQMSEPESVDICLRESSAFSIEKGTNSLQAPKRVTKLLVAYCDSSAIPALLEFISVLLSSRVREIACRHLRCSVVNGRTHPRPSRVL